jgi:AraC-like DNA-binding protein
MCEDGMLIAAQAFIRRHFGSTELTPHNIARRLGCSRAHLYRVFARRGLTIAGYLREIRLQNCRAALTAARPREPVADIAFRCGFTNLVYFARLFRERFGLRLRELRARGRERFGPAHAIKLPTTKSKKLNRHSHFCNLGKSWRCLALLLHLRAEAEWRRHLAVEQGEAKHC